MRITISKLGRGRLQVYVEKTRRDEKRVRPVTVDSREAVGAAVERLVKESRGEA